MNNQEKEAENQYWQKERPERIAYDILDVVRQAGFVDAADDALLRETLIRFITERNI